MSEYTEVIEPLEKKCPRCGGASASKGNPSGRCSACLKKLAAAKKKPGSWQRAQTKADDALRRQKGKNGTASKKSSGLGNRKSIVKQTQSAEKKTGEKLSPDRKNNAKGYASTNTRMVPEKLNRGRHHVDPKKLAAWKKKLKKAELDTASLYILMKAKYQNDNEVLELLKSLGPEGFERYIDSISDKSLEKSAAKKLEPVAPAPPSLAQHVGKTHTVEIHPDIDHLYRAKGLIKENNRPHLHIGDFKRHGFPGDIIKKIPRDANGKVTPEGIDKHIEGLPKHKVNVTVHPYEMGAQQHRDGPQYVATVGLHPENKLKMDNKHKDMWDEIKNDQHGFEQYETDHDNYDDDDYDENDYTEFRPSQDQVGWGRIDAHSKPDHWHLDEIQSDFQNKDKIKNNIYNDEYDDGDIKALHGHLSHGHKDPQHMVHSAINALGRKLGVKSMSMDTPNDQARQSALREKSDSAPYQQDHWRDQVHDHIMGGQVSDQEADNLWKEHGLPTVANLSHDIHFKSAAKKLGPEGLEAWAKQAAKDGSSYMQDGRHGILEEETEHLPKNLRDKLLSLSDDEKDAISRLSSDMSDHTQKFVGNKLGLGEEPKSAESEYKEPKYDLPVHQMDTYSKRPRKLGMKQVDKAGLLGDDPNDKAKNVQYMNLHKRLHQLVEELKKSIKLEKGIPSTKDVPASYSMTTKSPDFEAYTGKDAKAGQASVVKRAILLNGLNKDTSNKNFKNMINPITNKQELHILTHRGIGGNGKPIDKNATGPNKLSIGDDHVEQTHHAVHTLDPEVADNFGERHSFWVPVSQMVGTAKYLDGRYKDPNNYKPSGQELKEAFRHLKGNQGRFERYKGQHPDATEPADMSRNSIENTAREIAAHNPQGEHDSHIVVKPGKYTRHFEDQSDE